jgi:hypothetical protein
LVDPTSDRVAELSKIVIKQEIQSEPPGRSALHLPAGR